MKKDVDKNTTSTQSAQFLSGWKEVEPEIWQPRNVERADDPALLVAQTLFDQPRWLDAQFLYNAEGSKLFEQICRLPEYYLTRTEDAILERHAGAIIEAAGTGCLVELGAGFSVKTAHLLREIKHRFKEGEFTPIDVSRTALQGSREQVHRHFQGIRFRGLNSSYQRGIRAAGNTGHKLVIFLGSSIGNLMRSDLIRFLHDLSRSMRAGDYLLLGVDRVKERSLIEKAYDDRQGVTEAFILNSLANLNERFNTDFDAGKFEYAPRYNESWQQMELYLKCREKHRVHFTPLDIPIQWERGEELLVEVSRKFQPARLKRQFACYGYDTLLEFSDEREWFSLILFRKGRKQG